MQTVPLMIVNKHLLVKTLGLCWGLILWGSPGLAQSLEREVWGSAGSTDFPSGTRLDYTFGEVLIGTDQSTIPAFTIGFQQPIVTQPLAIEIQHFQVRKGSGRRAFKLSWRLSQVLIQPAHFEIERAVAGTDFYVVGSMEAQVGQAIQLPYDFEDQVDLGQEGREVFYRVKLIQPSGEQQWSNILSAWLEEEPDIRLYPNPARDHCTLQLLGAIDPPLVLRLTNALGQLVWQYRTFSAPQEIKISIETFPSGMYHLRVLSGPMTRNLPLYIE